MFEPGCSGLEDGPRSLDNRFEPGCSGLEDGPRSSAECIFHIFFSIFQRHPDAGRISENYKTND